MDAVFFQRPNIISPDIGDELEVFLYTNLSTMIAPNPSAILTPTFQASLTVALNNVGVRHNIDLPKDLKDILDIFIITQLVIKKPHFMFES